MRLYLCVLCLAWLLTSCDSVGRAVVGVHPNDGPPELCMQPLPCASLPLDPPNAVPERIEPVDLQSCKRAAMSLCASGAVSGGGRQCLEAPKDLSLSFSVAQDAEALRELSCRGLRLSHVAGDASAALQLELSAWSEVQLDVESAEPITLELAGGRMQAVSLALHGPITLRLRDVESGSDVRVLADNGRAHVELVRTQLSGVTLSLPEGDVLLRRSRLQGVAIRAEHLDVESAYVRDAVWQTASLSAADATLVRVRSEALRSVLSACNVEMMSFLTCQSLSTIDGFYRNVEMSACAEEAAIYGSDVTGAQIEGDLILDRASLHKAVLGIGEVGAIMAWDSLVADSSFCTEQQALSFGGMSFAHCAHCDLTPAPSVPDACLLEGAALRATNLESCPGLDHPPICGDPQPKRMRPPLN